MKSILNHTIAGGNPILERIGPIPSDNVTVMRSEPIKTYGSKSDYYLAALSVAIK